MESSPREPSLELTAERWPARLSELADRVRAAARGALLDALERGAPEELARVTGHGAGDQTFALDVPTEEVVAAWHAERAREGPLSVLTEEAGWRHLGPAPGGGVRELAGFDHGGPRLAVDPVDGTRNLMTDLRSAWTVVGLAGPGAGEPRLRDVELGLVAEIPTSRARAARVLSAARGRGARQAEVDLDTGRATAERPLTADADRRADHGYFPFFRYLPEQRPELARIEAAFFERLREREGADVRNCWDDQYISNGGQLALLALGTYRCIVDLRAWLAARRGRSAPTSKPYDLTGAVLVAREAGCALSAPDGAPLDFPLDCTTPVSFVGWANEPTRARLAPHLAAALASALG